MDNLRGLLGIRKMNRVPNVRIRELCGVRMEKDSIAKRVYVGECAGSRSVDKPRKRWIDIVKDCLRKRGLDVRQVRRMGQDSI